MLVVICVKCRKIGLYAECHYAECCYTDCRGAFADNASSIITLKWSHTKGSNIQILALPVNFRLGWK
jgi:hypothetical protein